MVDVEGRWARVPAVLSSLVGLGMLFVASVVLAASVVGVVVWRTHGEWQRQGFEKCEQDHLRGSNRSVECVEALEGP
jgi:hypothetical protein